MLGLLTGRLYLLPWWHHHPSEEKLSGWQGWPTVCPCQAEGTWRQWVWSLRDMFTNTHNHKVRCGAWTAHYTSYGIRSCDTPTLNSRNRGNEHKFKAMVDTPKIVQVAGHDYWYENIGLAFCTAGWKTRCPCQQPTHVTCQHPTHVTCQHPTRCPCQHPTRHMSTPHACHMSTPHTCHMSTPHACHMSTPPRTCVVAYATKMWMKAFTNEHVWSQNFGSKLLSGLAVLRTVHSHIDVCMFTCVCVYLVLIWRHHSVLQGDLGASEWWQYDRHSRRVPSASHLAAGCRQASHPHRHPQGPFYTTRRTWNETSGCKHVFFTWSMSYSAILIRMDWSHKTYIHTYNTYVSRHILDYVVVMHQFNSNCRNDSYIRVEQTSSLCRPGTC